MQADCVKYGRVASVVQHHRALFHLHLGYNFNIIVAKLLFAVLFLPVLFLHVLFIVFQWFSHKKLQNYATGTWHFLRLDDDTIMSFLVYILVSEQILSCAPCYSVSLYSSIVVPLITILQNLSS